jgi:hypothetical protein
MKLEFSRQIFEKYSNIKFHENPFSGSRDVLCRQTDIHKYTHTHTHTNTLTHTHTHAHTYEDTVYSLRVELTVSSIFSFDTGRRMVDTKDTVISLSRKTAAHEISVCSAAQRHKTKNEILPTLRMSRRKRKHLTCEGSYSSL